jgi:hypothetical protein
MYLLTQSLGGQEACPELFIRGAAILVPVICASLQWRKSLMAQYVDVPMDFADATLVALADDTAIRHVITLDRIGFQAYRTGKRETSRMLPG